MVGSYVVRIFRVNTVAFIAYAHGRRLHRYEKRHRSESVVDPQCIIDLMLVVYN